MDELKTGENLETALSIFDTETPDSSTEETATEETQETDQTATDHSKKETEDRFDKHPRFRELNAQKREAQRLVREKDREAYELKKAMKTMQEEIASLRQPTKKINPFKEIGVEDAQFEEHLEGERQYLREQLKKEILAELNAGNEQEAEAQMRNQTIADEIREDIEDELEDYPQYSKKEFETYLAENLPKYMKRGDYPNVTKAFLDFRTTIERKKIVEQKKKEGSVEKTSAKQPTSGYVSVIRRV